MSLFSNKDFLLACGTSQTIERRYDGGADKGSDYCSFLHSACPLIGLVTSSWFLLCGFGCSLDFMTKEKKTKHVLPFE